MKRKHILIAVIAIGLIASAVAMYFRWQVENSMQKYEVTMPFSEVLAMAELKNKSIEEELEFWREAGVDSISLSEITLQNLVARSGYDIELSYSGNDLLISGQADLIDDLAERFQNSLVDREVKKDDNKLRIEGSVNDFYLGAVNSKNVLIENSMGIAVRPASIVEYAGLGYNIEDIEMIKAAGLALRLRPAYVASLQDAQQSAARFLEVVDLYSNQPYIIFSGKEMLGLGGGEDLLLEGIKERSMAIAMIENSVQREHLKQKGIKKLVEKSDYQALRVFSTWDFIRNRYDYEMPLHHNGEEIINTYYRAITERNINVIYFKPFLKHNKLIDLPLEVYQDNFNTLNQRLAKHGITSYQDGDFYRQALDSNRFLAMFAAFAVLAAGLLILELLFGLPTKLFYFFLLLPIVITATLYSLGKAIGLLNTVFGLLATVIFASLAVVFILKKAADNYQNQQKQSFFQTAIILLLALGISLSGAIIEVAFFADSKHILEMAIFRGVKFSQLLPLVLAFIIAIIVFADILFPQTDISHKKRVENLLKQSIKVWQLVLAGIAAIFIFLLLSRSGHEGSVKPLTTELLFRNSLEYFLYARPRTKSFILAFPAYFLLFDLINKRKFKWFYPFLAVLLAIGQADVLNTFSHFRTPLIMSFWRIVYAYLLGLLFYAIFYMIYLIIERGIKFLSAKFSE